MNQQLASDQSKRHVSHPAPDSKSNLLASYLQLFREFRRQDLKQFCEQHEMLYRKAKQSGDHREVTQHYYGLMASVIATYYGEGWHFCPPEFKGQDRRAATIALYRKISESLGLAVGHRSLDIGCGVGGMMRFLARETGASIAGITLGENEVEEANRLADAQGLGSLNHVVQGDSQEMPFDDKSFDSAFAVYALKYYPTLDRVFSEIQRVLKPGGKFIGYCLCKSRSFRADNPDHSKLLGDFEYSTAMPSLHSVESMIVAAENAGLACVSESDISDGDLNWYSYWVSNPFLPWLVSSRLIYGLTKTAETVRILPPGFTRFNDTFLAGTLRHIIRGGRTGVLTGSALLTFVKR